MAQSRAKDAGGLPPGRDGRAALRRFRRRFSTAPATKRGEPVKRMRSILAGLLAALLCVGCASPASDAAPDGAPDPAPAEAVEEKIYPDFTDVPEGIWYAGAAYWCRRNDIMYGTAETVFSPLVLLTRGMLTMVLYQEAGSPAAGGLPGYTDVPEGAWYAPSVIWCTENASVNGYGGGLFGPEDPMTREQIIAVLWRYSGCPETEAGEDFADEADISAYAQRAVDWSRINGIILGMGENRFEPQRYVTRAQAAVIFQRYFQWRRGMSAVFMTEDLSPQGLVAVYRALGWKPTGRLAVKLATGETSSYCLRPSLIGDLIRMLGAPIVECNSADGGVRSRTESHLRLAEALGYAGLTEVDILDRDGEITLPVTGGRYLKENYVGSRFADYDAMLVLTHFSGHEMAGFSGAMENLSMGLASAAGKSHIRSGGAGSTMWGASQEAYLDSMAEAGQSVADALEGQLVYINVLTQLSVDCDCGEDPAQPEMADIGFLASRDPVALDQACIDLINAAEDGGALVRRINGSGGERTLEHAEELGLGSRGYYLIMVEA